MFKCKCEREFESQKSLNSHARFCKLYEKKIKENEHIKDGKYVCECGKSFDNSQSLNAHFSHCLIHKENKPLSRNYDFGGKRNWNKGLTKETSDSVAKYGKTYSEIIKLGIISGSMKGKTHTNESKQKMSNSAKVSNNGYVKTKWHSVYCPYIKEYVKVQGSWELKYAEYLNSNNINWIRTKVKINYKLRVDDIIRNYHPDFYLIDSEEYIEIKGRWWKSSDGRVDDRRKMDCVIKQNPDIKIIIIEKIDF